MNFLLKTNEIVLKKRKRSFFTQVLINNLRKKFPQIKIKNLGGLFWVILDGDKEKLISDFRKIFGLSKILPVEKYSTLEEFLENFKPEGIKDYSLNVKRGTKDYYLNSPQIVNKVQKYFEEKYNLKFERNSPNKFALEYHRGYFFFSKEIIEGAGGLPVGSSGKGLALLSAGFDSPVASYLALKRGLKLSFLHFHSYPQTKKEVIEAVKKLVEILNEYNLGSKLFLLNILDLQKFYFQKVPKNLLVIFYRRSMFRLAQKLAERENLKVIITGENLGQVASQTIENLKVISQATNFLVIQPLICFDKQEIINLSKKIGTFQVSSNKFQDCCALFIPSRVITKADLKIILDIENSLKIQIENLENEIFEKLESLTL